MINKDSFSLKEIIKRGGGIVISASDYDGFTLKEFCRFAKASGAQIVVKNATKLSFFDCTEMAKLNPGNVIFDFADKTI